MVVGNILLNLYLIPIYGAKGAAIATCISFIIMFVVMFATYMLINKTSTGRQLYAFGDNPEGARRSGINIALMQFIAFGWMGAMAGVAGFMQVNIVQEVVPMALLGRELEV